MILVFDTETTGKAFFDKPHAHLSQPRMVSLAAGLYAAEGRELACMNVIIYPEGYAIPTEAANVHGITTEIAKSCGVPVAFALSLFESLANRAERLVAFNAQFDRLIVGHEISRTNFMWRYGDPYCAMLAATEICKLPGPYGFKWPKLAEAYRHFFGEEHTKAHDALGDLRATARVYFEIQRRKNQEGKAA